MNSCMLGSSWKGYNHSAVLSTYLRSHLWQCVFIQVQGCGEWCERNARRTDDQLEMWSKQGPQLVVANCSSEACRLSGKACFHVQTQMLSSYTKFCPTFLDSDIQCVPMS